VGLGIAWIAVSAALRRQVGRVELVELPHIDVFVY
jgi:hypothetical protein